MKLFSLCAISAGVLISASTANAAITFSFASDTNPDGPTFNGFTPAGGGNTLRDGAPFDSSGAVEVGLLVDANGDLPGGATTFTSRLLFNGSTTGYNVTGFGGAFTHSWTMTGSIEFIETGSNLTVLTINFTNALFSSFSDSMANLGTSATIQGNRLTDPSLSFVAGQPLNGLGITSASLSANQSFGFSLSDIRTAAGGASPVEVGLNGSWPTAWISEGSFSAAAIPAPAVLALFGIAGTVGMRRRRI